jgi:hypothetical protein
MRKYKTNYRKSSKKKRTKRGGAADKSKGTIKNKDDTGFKLAKGFLVQIKMAIAERIAWLINGQVTKRLQDKFLVGIPTEIKMPLEVKLDKIAEKLVRDMSAKGLSMMENLLRATPGVGNAYSLVAMVDKGIAAARNMRAAVNKIARDVEEAKAKMREMGLSTDMIPSVPSLEAPAVFTDALAKVNELKDQATAKVSELKDTAAEQTQAIADQAEAQTQAIADQAEASTQAIADDVESSTQAIANETEEALQKGGKKYKRLLTRVNRSITKFNNSTRRRKSTR